MGDFGYLILTQICLAAGPGTHSARPAPVYFGTYTENTPSQGIYRSILDLTSGKLSEPQLVAKTGNPSFLVLHPSGRFLYSVNEKSPDGRVRAFSVDGETGALTLINERSSRGAGPCHLSLDRTGKVLLVANYNSGSAALYPLGEDGRLGVPTGFAQHAGSSVHPRRQTGPHAHSINVSPDNRFVLVADLGLDKLMVYRLAIENVEIIPHAPPFVTVQPGAGPRHFTFDSQGRFAYLLNELNGTLVAFSYTPASGVLQEIQTISTLPKGYSGGNGCAEVSLHPNGRFLYASNRGHNSIAVYRVDRSAGTLSLIQHQHAGIRTPRHFSLDPSGRYCLVANQGADSVLVFVVDADTGQLIPTEHAVTISKPVCVRFLDYSDR